MFRSKKKADAARSATPPPPVQSSEGPEDYTSDIPDVERPVGENGARPSGFWRVDSAALTNRVKSVRLVPRTNNELEMMNSPEAMVAHAILAGRLKDYMLKERVVEGDGNCQFRALSDQLFGTDAHHEIVRFKVFEQLVLYPEFYKDYVDEDYEKYCDGMKDATTWGDHVTLQAAADSYGIRILLIASFDQDTVIEVFPKQPKTYTDDCLFLSYWAGIHYNSIISSDVDDSALPVNSLDPKAAALNQSRMQKLKSKFARKAKGKTLASEGRKPGKSVLFTPEPPSEPSAAQKANNS